MGKHNETEWVILVWFEKKRIMNVCLNATINKEKAKEISLILNNEYCASMVGLINSWTALTVYTGQLLDSLKALIQ
jgi:hypothetical protein